MAIRADRRLLRPLLNRPPVHALLVADEGLRALAVRVHQELLPVAPSAGGRNLRVIHRRFRIAPASNLVRVPVAVLAASRPLPCPARATACATPPAPVSWHCRTAIFFGVVVCAASFTSVWQSTHANKRPWMECLNLSASTNRLTVLPFSVVVSVSSPWQARHPDLSASAPQTIRWQRPLPARKRHRNESRA